ncbi:metal-dependent phosphohydrolase [Brachyspira hampsonii]|uniref:Metal-dependent phosphohydrolase n=1 Tax=Brachyspira hampsonii TaxID=1287055 RepID=A0A1E5ND37_9SPIR|nr:HDIG domain-containing metalloprotein [Brachyspira hampsonii]OEJ14065.1 metal-dependent phosphohydrolase [Brachyspira hampsonii]
MNTNKKIAKSVLSKTPNIERFFQLTIAILLYLFTLFLVFPTYIQKVDIPNVGDIVTEPFIVKKNVKYENKAETEKLTYYTEATIAPIFDMPKNIEYEALSKISNMFSFIRISHDNNIPIDEIYNQFLLIYDEPINKSVFSNAVVSDLNIGYEAKIIETIKELFGVGILSRGNLSSDTLSLILNNGIFVYSYDNYIIEERLLPRNRVFFLEDLRVELPSIIGTKYRNLNINHINSISAIVNAFLKDNLIYNSSKTKEKINDVKSSLDPVYNLIKKGFPILTVGERVTEEKAELIRNLFGNNFGGYSVAVFTGQALFILILFSFIGFIIFKYKIPFYINFKNFILFAIEYIVIVSVTYLFYNHVSYNSLNIYIPFYVYTFIPIFSIINSLLGAKRGISSIITLSITLLAANVAQAGLFEISALFLISVFASILSKKIHNRYSILLIGLLIGAYLSIMCLIDVLLNDNIKINYLTIIFAFTSGFAQSILVMIFLPIIEYVLETATIFRLQELSDLNNPLLRKLQMNAPGTYHHSISMANLVETIAEEIGEDARLACVSAYYHDIGKMENPLYYIENSNKTENRHNKLKPTLSASIVKAHIRLGVEMAKKYRLPKEVIAAIKEHHGTTLIKYFYVEALKENPDVDINLFRYPGPRPQSKITAILMILDSIEAASRSLDSPKREDLEMLIDHIVNDKMSSGELNDSGLTLKDIEIIKKISFQQIMASLHERIKYPELNNNNNDENDKNKENEENEDDNKKEEKDSKKQIVKYAKENDKKTKNNVEKIKENIKEKIAKKLPLKHKGEKDAKELKYNKEIKESKENKESVKK